MSAPTILDAAALIRANTGRDPLPPAWEASGRAVYGLELRHPDVERLQATTRRTALGIGALSGTGKPMREAWFRAGRRSRKSFEAAFFADYEAVYGGHESYLVPGERGLIAIVSKDVAGSTAVARFCELHAQALGIRTNWTSMGAVRILELEGIPFGIACFPCSAKAPRGYAIPVVICDEIAHWQTDSDEYSNSDTEVLAAIRPAMAQFPNSKLFAISSPLGHEGVFHETVEANLGDDAAPGIFAAEGPTWAWNPDITEARTHELEKDPDTHAREFGAIPSSTEGTAFHIEDAARCFEPRQEAFVRRRPVLALDPASSSNTFAWIVAEWCDPDPTVHYKRLIPPPGCGLTPDCFIGYEHDTNGREIPLPVATRPVLFISQIGGWTGEELRATTMDVIAAELGSIAANVGADVAFSDEHGGTFLAALLAPHGLRMSPVRQSQPSKHDAVQLIRTLMRDRQLVITGHEGMEKDLRTYPRRVVGGGFRYGAPRAGHHWDYVSALIVLAHGLLGDDSAPTPTSHVVEGNPIHRFRGGRYIASGR